MKIRPTVLSMTLPISWPGRVMLIVHDEEGNSILLDSFTCHSETDLELLGSWIKRRIVLELRRSVDGRFIYDGPEVTEG
jgi:hypothetical protein